tara:strand:- start:148 stop:606 length:459 start_codon:yes stop_codon:yes gene_type:complete
MSEIKWVDGAEFFASHQQYKIVNGKAFYGDKLGWLESGYTCEYLMSLPNYIKRPRQDNSTGDWPKVGDIVTWGFCEMVGEVKCISDDLAWIKSEEDVYINQELLNLREPLTPEQLLMKGLMGLVGCHAVKSSAALAIATDIMKYYNLTKKPQ